MAVWQTVAAAGNRFLRAAIQMAGEEGIRRVNTTHPGNARRCMSRLQSPASPSMTAAVRNRAHQMSHGSLELSGWWPQPTSSLSSCPQRWGGGRLWPAAQVHKLLNLKV